MTEIIRVLHVDDEPDFAELAATFLKREEDRFDIETVTSPRRGLERLVSHEFDCVVSDYDMPERNGIEFLQRIREDYPNLPFILYTGKGSEEIASEAISSGVTDYLQKESGTSQYTVLAHRIRNAVKQYRSRQAVEETEQKLSQLAEETDDVLFMFDGDWSDLLFINSAFEDIWGIPSERLEESPEAFIEPVHPEDRDEARRSLERIADGHPDEFEYRVVPSAGDQRWVRGQGKPIFDDDGNVTRIVGFVRDITERKEQERKRQQIIERVTDAIVEVDADWTFTLVNEQAEELYDIDKEYLHGRDFWDVFREALGTRFEEVYREVMETREPASFVEYYTGLSGWFDIQVYPEDDGGLAFYFQEVTERIERSRELERTRDILEHTERIADVGGWEIDTETRDVFWTDHLFEMLERDADEEPPLEEALDVYVKQDRPLVENAVEEALAAGEPFDVDARFERDGEIRWFQIRGEPTTEDGDVVTLRGAVQDVTERKERKRKLEQTEARFKSLAENFPNGGVHYFDEDLRYQYVSGAGFDPIDTSPGDLVGNTIYEVEPYSAEIVDALESLMKATLSGTEETIEVAYEDHIFELRSVPIRDTDGVIGGFFISQDVTDQRRRGRALERRNEQLERFASIVSHDLRNPLSVAQGRLELAMAECDSEHLGSIDNALERSQRLIDDLLTLARDGNHVSDIEPVALESLVEGCWDNVETAEAAIEGEVNRTVRADRSRLRQLLENLYRNAVEHGGDDVTVTTGVLSNGFYIEDDGPGISVGERADVFGVGYSTTDEGTGFGLSIVKQIAEAHGWEVSVTDSDAGGARFEITGVEFTEY